MTTFDFNNMCKLGLHVYVSRPTFTVFLTHHELYQAWLYGRILGNFCLGQRRTQEPEE